MKIRVNLRLSYILIFFRYIRNSLFVKEKYSHILSSTAVFNCYPGYIKTSMLFHWGSQQINTSENRTMTLAVTTWLLALMSETETQGKSTSWTGINQTLGISWSTDTASHYPDCSKIFCMQYKHLAVPSFLSRASSSPRSSSLMRSSAVDALVAPHSCAIIIRPQEDVRNGLHSKECSRPVPRWGH